MKYLCSGVTIKPDTKIVAGGAVVTTMNGSVVQLHVEAKDIVSALTEFVKVHPKLHQVSIVTDYDVETKLIG